MREDKCRRWAWIIGASALGLQRVPPEARRARPVARASVALVLLRGRRTWLCPHGSGLFRGLWTFPRVAARGALPPGPRAQLLGELSARTHAYTRYRERLLPRVYAVSGRFGDCEGEWVPLATLALRPMPSAHRRIADELIERLEELGGA